MSGFDLERLDRAAIISALFPDQTVDPGFDGLVSVRCIWPGCAANRHQNGDRTPSGLFSPRTGYYKCQATGAEASGWRDTVSEVLGPAAWERYREACFTEPRGGGGKALEELWRGLEREHRWTDLYRIDPELSARYLRAGRRRSGEVYSDSVLGIFDARGKITGVKFRLPPGKRWVHPPGGGHPEDKYLAQKGSKVSGVVFLGDRVREGAALVVCAGEKDALVAASHLDPARWSPVSSCVGEGPAGPAKPWVTALSACARGRDVVIAYDGDPPGHRGAWHLARALDGVAASVRALVLPAPDELPPPKGEDRWDVAAFVLERGREALEQLLAAAGPVPATWEPPPPPPGLASGGAAKAAGAGAERQDAGLGSGGAGAARRRPAGAPKRVVVCAQVMDMVDEAEAALAGARLGVYQRGGDLVRVVHVDDQARVVTLPEPTLLELLSRAGDWVKVDDEGEEKPAVPPRDVVRALAARGEWIFPALDRVVHGPVLRPDGTVLDQPGYDAGARVIYEPRGATVPRVPERPTQVEARAALARLHDVVGEFPFVDHGDRAAWVALVLTLLARAAIDGPVPLFLVRAVSPGTGKSLLIDVAALIGTDGEGEPARMSQAPNAEEEGKALLALGREGAPLAMIDNIERPLGSDVLAAALTARRFKRRDLGRTVTLEVELPVFVATGNNVVVRGDLARRVIPIDLDARMEHPEQRTGFRYPRLLQHVRAHRGELRAAALTVLRWYCAEGRPPAPAGPVLGSYEAWSGLVVQALLWLGEPDPCAGRARIQEFGDPEGEARRAALELWWEKWGPLEQTALDVASTAGEELRAALAGLGYGLSAEKLDVKRLGYALRSLAGRIVGGLRLERAPGSRRSGVSRWRVARAGAPDAAMPVGEERGGEVGGAGAARAEGGGARPMMERPAGRAEAPQFGGQDLAAGAERELFGTDGGADEAWEPGRE
ncbi:MAG: hypothetical protein KF878_00205 [Planctomycetes bacterium]|nr:hypothetical protein [Planctomycetota bacterium]